MYLSFEADWIPFRGSLSFFFSLLFHSFLRFADETCDFAKCLCLCLCPKEREKLKEDVFLAMSLPSYLQIKVGFVSQKYVSEREREVSENEKSKQTQTIQARGRLCTYLTPSRSEGEVEGKFLGFGTVSGSNVSGCSWAVRLEEVIVP